MKSVTLSAHLVLKGSRMDGRMVPSGALRGVVLLLRGQYLRISCERRSAYSSSLSTFSARYQVKNYQNTYILVSNACRTAVGVHNWVYERIKLIAMFCVALSKCCLR